MKMDWPGVVDQNRVLLLRVVESLFALVGLGETAAIATLPRQTRNQAMRILRPVESAVRRLIVIAAQGIEAPAARLSSRGSENRFPHMRGRRRGGRPKRTGAGATDRPPSFSLLDPRKRFFVDPPRRYARTFPRISVVGVTEPRPLPGIRLPAPLDPVGAAGLCRRLRAVRAALDDVDRQARRLARWNAKRDLGRTKYVSPLRPGWPPGRRRRPVHEIDDVLRDLHSLARCAMETADTS